jgi:hypothetical protein
VEKIAGPLLADCGGDDTVWRFCLLSQAVIDR